MTQAKAAPPGRRFGHHYFSNRTGTNPVKGQDHVQSYSHHLGGHRRRGISPFVVKFEESTEEVREK